MLYFFWGRNGGHKIEEEKLKVWISLIQNLGIKRYNNLIQKFGSKYNLYCASKEQLIKVEGIGEKLSSIISNKEIKKDLSRHLEYMNKHNISIISIEDKEYPSLLKEIDNPPLCIYIIGNKKILDEINLAIVGCREATEYGKNVAKEFAYQLAKKEINIVSGLARGIDSFAHIGAVNAGGKTIAVLGNGLDTIYPEENYSLAKNIINTGGAIITEYPLGTKPNRENFPYRNRIISGLCNGIIVVEAKAKSGTMITVDYALEQGRDVFVIPGNIDSINSIGTNELIKQGARLVTKPNEIVEDINL